MKILFLCNKSPYPPKEGGPMAMNANIEGLINEGHQVKVLALNTNKYFIHSDDIPDDYKNKTGIELIYNDLSVKPTEAFLNLFSKKSYHVERFFCREFEDKIIEVLKHEEFDIVQLEMLYMLTYIETIRKFTCAKIVLRSHNIEHLIWGRITESTKNPLKRKYLGYLTGKLKRYELKTMDEIDGIVAISDKDAEYYTRNGCTKPVTGIPFGVNINDYKISKTENEFPSLFHLGSMNWIPNEEGIKWFLKNAWPKIHQKFPQLKFYLAGRMMPQWLMNLNEPNIEVLGEVEDARDFILSKGIMIVPLFSGSGIRIKIIEGMALGKAVISTVVGAEGINYTDGENILIANTPEEFVNAVKKSIGSKEFCDQIGNNSRKLIEQDYNIQTTSQKLVSFYQKILEN